MLFILQYLNEDIEIHPSTSRAPFYSFLFLNYESTPDSDRGVVNWK
jgi:hypothetical protein